jgi:hypothetical protein
MTKPTSRSRRWIIPIGGCVATIWINADHQLVITGFDDNLLTCSPLDAANLALALQQAAAIASVGYAKATKAKVLGGIERFADIVIGATKGGR